MASPRVVSRRRRRTQASSSKKKEKEDDTKCENCGSGDFGSKLLLCDDCDRGFHLFCLRPILASVPNGSWFCPACCSSNRRRRRSLSPSRFPLVQTKIIDFFRIQRSTEKAACQGTIYKKRRRARSLATSKKRRRRLLAFTPTEDSVRRLEQMASLATALTATGAEFSNELTYIHGMAPKSANCSDYEKGGMQVLSREDTEALNLCKDMMRKGECPPLMVVFDPIEGFTVEADKFIKDMTIITEYVGDVDYLQSRENDDGDSIMTLICAADSSKSLVICPDKRSNIARFINGINNHTPEGKKKQNLKCVRFNVDGEARVLLVANRDISKGERLYYDYNAYEHEYPTEHFV
ncbi:hypothetical protein SSX86_018030 [Deinandra increscens subsp. villosa]|uniref:[histone H3]-lysine(27) N-methyltransferase n=1 Tax=Deinandra increscens subsp. villosa TaxID=3103831 RepID=A0AAP0CPZ9_9ASTR